jgi:hypothetical protein
MRLFPHLRRDAWTTVAYPTTYVPHCEQRDIANFRTTRRVARRLAAYQVSPENRDQAIAQVAELLDRNADDLRAKLGRRAGMTSFTVSRPRAAMSRGQARRR